jgi:hypothetical protein
LFVQIPMIYETLNFTADHLNSYFRKSYAITQDLCTVSNIIDQNGSTPIEINDKLVVCLVSIEQETSLANLGFTKPLKEGLVYGNPPLNLNLNVLLAANFSNYSESLKIISSTISFFQRNYVFSEEAKHKLPKGVNRLVFEMMKLDSHASSHIWNTLGAKYLPSVIYKIRMLTINDPSDQKKAPILLNPEVDVST